MVVHFTEINSDDWAITKKTTRTIKHEHFSKIKILKVDRRALSIILDDKKLNTTDLWRSCATMSCFHTHEHFSKIKILKVDRRALSLILDDKKLNTTDLWRSCATMSCFPIIRYNRIHIATRTSDRRRKCRPHKRIVIYEETCEYCTNAPANVHCWNDNTIILDTDISFSNDRDGNLTTNTCYRRMCVISKTKHMPSAGHDYT